MHRAAAATVALVLAASAGSVPEPLSGTAHGIDLTGIDHAVQPGMDFFRYANGNWLKKTQIPADRSNTGNVPVLVELTGARVRALIEGAEKASGAESPESRQIGDYYASFMDASASESKGLQPLAPALKRIAGIEDRTALSRALGASVRSDVDLLNNTNLHTENLFGLWVAGDLCGIPGTGRSGDAGS
jgi:predicted metalloendopeptidase